MRPTIQLFMLPSYLLVEVQEDIATQRRGWIIEQNQKTYITRMVMAQLKGVNSLDVSPLSPQLSQK
jgi:hypothetical protein